MNEEKPQSKWYFKTSVFVIAFLCVGPLALPLLWFNPRFNLKIKIVISVIFIILSYFLWIVFVKSLESLNIYYNLLKELLE